MVLVKNTKLALEFAETRDERKRVVEIFISESKTALDEIKKAKDSFAEANSEFKKASASIMQLQNWLERKKIELDAEENKRLLEQRGLAYGSTAGATTALGFLLCLTGVGLPAGKIFNNLNKLVFEYLRIFYFLY